MDLLNRMKTDAVEPQKIAALIHLIKDDLGYQLHQSVQAVKYELPNNVAATFVTLMEQLILLPEYGVLPLKPGSALWLR